MTESDHRRLVLPSMVLLLLTLSAVGVRGDSAAYDTVSTATEQLMAKLKEIQPLFATDEARFYQEIEGSLAPYIDFDGFARGVMAKYYRLATPEQRHAFSRRFREDLLATYARALVSFDNQEIVIRQDSRPSTDPSKATVLLDVHGKDGAVYPIEYSMVMDDGRWKLRNVVINGINVGLQFRSQFSAYMQKHRNDVDAVITDWRVDG